MRLEKIANAKHMNTKKEILDKFFTAILDSKAELQTKFREEVGPQAVFFLRLMIDFSLIESDCKPYFICRR